MSAVNNIELRNTCGEEFILFPRWEKKGKKAYLNRVPPQGKGDTFWETETPAAKVESAKKLRVKLNGEETIPIWVPPYIYDSYQAIQR